MRRKNVGDLTWRKSWKIRRRKATRCRCSSTSAHRTTPRRCGETTPTKKRPLQRTNQLRRVWHWAVIVANTPPTTPVENPEVFSIVTELGPSFVLPRACHKQHTAPWHPQPHHHPIPSSLLPPPSPPGGRLAVPRCNGLKFLGKIFCEIF